MKYEIIKGSEKDFEGAPEWATECVWNDKGSESFSYWLNPKENKMLARWMNGSPDIWAGIYGHRNYIKAERRPITEPVVNQQLTTEWGEDGLPPVGCICEFKAEDGSWGVGTILCVGSHRVFWLCHEDKMEYNAEINPPEFRPIRSPEDVARDEAFSQLEALEKSMLNGYQPYEFIDAITLAGYRKFKTPTVSELMRVTEKATREDCEAIVKLMGGEK